MAAPVRSFRHTYLDAETIPFWLDRSDTPRPYPPLSGPTDADLVIVGAGFTGLWAAIQAKHDDPAREVLVLEGDTIAFGASGRNGGFCDATLTHGLENGIARFPDEIETIERMAAESFAGLEATVRDLNIECDWVGTGEVAVATEPHQVGWMREGADLERRHGYDTVFLDQDQVRAELNSPRYLAGLWKRNLCAVIDPARLAWGLARAAEDLGVRFHERTRVTGLGIAGAGVRAKTPAGDVMGGRVVLATNGFTPLVRSIRRYVVPVYDHVLMTEPLTDEQRASIGWDRRQGFSEAANRFHYFRTSDDGRILWGGYDAVYHWRNGVDPRFEQWEPTFDKLAGHFYAMFPQLESVRFSHRWGGVIDTSSRFSVMFGTALSGRVSYAVGYTGMGVAASRFGARVALDLADGLDTERTRLRLVRSKPVPFPPEPLRWMGVTFTEHEMERADRNVGKRGVWLKALDMVGLGVDS